MHTPQPAIKNPEDGQIEGPVVMASAAGWYVGEVYYDAMMGCWAPHDRLSVYGLKHEVEAWLEKGSWPPNF